MTFYEDHEVIGVTLPENKNIDDFGLEYDEYSERMKKWEDND